MTICINFLVDILVIYCCGTNYPILSILKQQTLSHSFCGSRTRVQIIWACHIQGPTLGHSQAVKSDLQYHLKARLRGSTSKLNDVAVRLREPFPHWLLAGGYLWFLAMWMQLTKWQPTSNSEQVRVRENIQNGRQSFYNLISEMISHHHLCHILFIRSVSLGPPHTQGEGITHVSLMRQGSLWVF